MSALLAQNRGKLREAPCPVVIRKQMGVEIVGVQNRECLYPVLRECGRENEQQEEKEFRYAPLAVECGFTRESAKLRSKRMIGQAESTSGLLGYPVPRDVLTIVERLGKARRDFVILLPGAIDVLLHRRRAPIRRERKI
jgi:hypothetical protein